MPGKRAPWACYVILFRNIFQFIYLFFINHSLFIVMSGRPVHRRKRRARKVLAVVKQARTARRHRHTSNRGSKRMPVAGPSVTAEYCKSLVDPFEHLGCRLGWGTMIPTTLSQAVLRGSVTADAFGNVQLFALPFASTLAVVYGGLVNAYTTGTIVPALNNTAIKNGFSEGRPISLGLKSWPNLGLNSPPGTLYQGAGVINPLALSTTIVATDLQAWTTTVVDRGIYGGTVTGRPIDVTSFTFDPSLVNATGAADIVAATNNTFDFSIPYQYYSGIGAATVVQYEITLNFEGITLDGHATTSIVPGFTGAGELMLSDEHTNAESMWQKVKNYLLPPATSGISSQSSAADRIGLAVDQLVYYRRAAAGIGLGVAALGFATGALGAGAVGSAGVAAATSLMPYVNPSAYNPYRYAYGIAAAAA
jgi:hypothetical protein